MKKSNGLVTQTQLKKLFNYDHKTGIFTRLVSTNYNACVGDTAGYRQGNGYLRIKIKRRLYLAHRLAWLYVRGHWPTYQIDHKNGVRYDNRISNLREATNSEQQQNRKIGTNNTSGFTGVWWGKKEKRWRTAITINGKEIYIGQYRTIEEARAAYSLVKKTTHRFQSYQTRDIT